MTLSSETVLRLIIYTLAFVIIIGCAYCVWLQNVWLQRSATMIRQSSLPIWDDRHRTRDRVIHGTVTPTIAPELNRHPMLEPDNSRNTDAKTCVV